MNATIESVTEITLIHDQLATLEINSRINKQKRLDIIAKLAEIKRQYFVDKIETPFTERLTLEAELAKLESEKNSLRELATVGKYQRRIAMEKAYIPCLEKILKDSGLEHIIKSAQKQSGWQTPEYRQTTSEG